MIEIIGHRYWYFLISTLIIVPGALALVLWGLRPGIDFTGGTRLELQFSRPVQTSEVEQVYKEQGFSDVEVQLTANNTALVRSGPMDVDQKAKLLQALGRLGDVKALSEDTVGATIGGETTRLAIVAVLVASAAILIYISIAFRAVENPWRYGTCAVVALLHDVLVVVGLWSIFGHFWGFEVDIPFVTALLTIIGFSVHDTIVVFDRIRENLSRRTGEAFETVVNNSVVQTLARSLNTSLTVLFTLLALYLFGGVTIRSFALCLLIGITSGTYSSIFNASCLLVVWENHEWRTWFSRSPRPAVA